MNEIMRNLKMLIFAEGSCEFRKIIIHYGWAPLAAPLHLEAFSRWPFENNCDLQRGLSGDGWFVNLSGKPSSRLTQRLNAMRSVWTGPVSDLRWSAPQTITIVISQAINSLIASNDVSTNWIPFSLMPTANCPFVWLNLIASPLLIDSNGNWAD